MDFLDISIIIQNNFLDLNLCDKRNDFKFTVYLMSHWINNLHKKIFINILMGQLSRIFKICNSYCNHKNMFLILMLIYIIKTIMH